MGYVILLGDLRVRKAFSFSLGRVADPLLNDTLTS